MPDDGLVTDGCQQMQILVFLTDHEGSTVSHAINEAKRIIAEVNSPQVEFLLAGGNVGVMAASNEAVKRAEVIMLGALFGSVALFLLADLPVDPRGAVHSGTAGDRGDPVQRADDPARDRSESRHLAGDGPGRRGRGRLRYLPV